MTIKLHCWPNDSRRITSPFGMRWGEWHDGIDIGAIRPGQDGDPIYSVADGEIIISKINNGGLSKGYGYYLGIKHNGYCSLYGHLKYFVGMPEFNAGDKVKTGQIIGYMGNTGSSTAAHLHFRLVEGDTISFEKDASGITLGSVDPVPYLEAIEKEKEVVSSWAKDGQEWVREKGISDGSRPKDPITREEVWTMLYRFNNLK